MSSLPGETTRGASSSFRFSLSWLLLMISAAPPVFAIFAGAFGDDLRLLALLAAVFAVCLVVYVVLAMSALLLTLSIPWSLWKVALALERVVECRPKAKRRLAAPDRGLFRERD